MAELNKSDAVGLFIERAWLVRQDFVLTNENASKVSQIVRRLDGIPLAIELAAARLRSLSLVQIDQRLDNAFALIRAKALESLGFHYLMLSSYHPVRDQSKTALSESLAIYQANDLDEKAQYKSSKAWSLLWLSEIGTISEPDQAYPLAQEAFSLFRETGDVHGIAESLQGLGGFETDLVRRKKMAQEQLEVDEANGDVEGIATAQIFIGEACFLNGDFAEAATAFESSLVHYQQINNPNMVANALLHLGITHLANGNFQYADHFLDQALEYFSGFSGVRGEGFIIQCYFYKCFIAIAGDRLEQAETEADKAWQVVQETGHQAFSGYVLFLFAHIARLRGDYSLSRNYAEQILLLTGTHSLSKIMVCFDTQVFPKMLAWLELGYLAFLGGDLKQAGVCWRDGIRILYNYGDLSWLFFPMESLALLAVQEGQLERAARLFGARWSRCVFNFLSLGERRQHEEALARVNDALGERHSALLYEAGRTLTLEQAVALALDEEG